MGPGPVPAPNMLQTKPSVLGIIFLHLFCIQVMQGTLLPLKTHTTATCQLHNSTHSELQALHHLPSDQKYLSPTAFQCSLLLLLLPLQTKQHIHSCLQRRLHFNTGTDESCSSAHPALQSTEITPAAQHHSALHCRIVTRRTYCTAPYCTAEVYCTVLHHC